jgi:hypothetical protein
MMRKFRFVGSEGDARAYSHRPARRPTIGEVYNEDEEIGGSSVGHWADEPYVREEWEEVVKPFDLTYSPNFDENVNVHINPRHYKNGKVECIDAIESAVVGKVGIEATCVSNILKYLWRYEDKNGIVDVKKAKWYLDKLINVIEERTNES